MYPVPAFRSARVRPVSVEIGIKTEYMAADARPTISVYLGKRVSLLYDGAGNGLLGWRLTWTR